MYSFQQDISHAIGWYTNTVRIGERRALCIAENACQPVVGVRLYRKTANWLSDRLLDRNHVSLYL